MLQQMFLRNPQREGEFFSTFIDNYSEEAILSLALISKRINTYLLNERDTQIYYQVQQSSVDYSTAPEAVLNELECKEIGEETCSDTTPYF